jgi:hypothetical protein
MKKLSLFVAFLAVCAAPAAQAANIEVCHRPPGNPDNWHTITISTSALPAHQAHGDLVGSCLTNCGALCDDGNKCTIDVVPGTNECPPRVRHAMQTPGPAKVASQSVAIV